MTRNKFTIAVSGLNAIDSPGPGVAVIRGLREAASFDVRIIGLAYESLEPGIYMRDMVDKTYQIPYPSAGTEVLYERLMYIHSKENLDMIIPNFDAELYPFIKLDEKLRASEIMSFLPTLIQYEERQKVNLCDFGGKYGLKVPESISVYDLSTLKDGDKTIEYPVLVKGKFYDAWVAYNSEQLHSYFNKVSAKWGLPVIIQDYIRGNEYNVCGLGDGTGDTIAAIPMRKQYITDKGKAWGGISIADPEMLRLTRNFVKKTKWRGPFELELMKTNTNEFYLLEINPRMPAWVYLSVAVGQNIPEAVVRLAMGEKVTPFEAYQTGKMFVRYAWDMIVDIKDFEQISTFGEL